MANVEYRMSNAKDHERSGCWTDKVRIGPHMGQGSFSTRGTSARVWGMLGKRSGKVNVKKRRDAETPKTRARRSRGLIFDCRFAISD